MRALKAAQSIGIALVFLSISLSAFGATYYIDFDGGSDAAAGTNTATAWKSIPSTRNVGDTADVSSSYGGGTFSTSSKVPGGTTFMIRGGTTWGTNDGGRINIVSSWYDDASAAAPIVFMVDTNWGSGAVTIDGTGMTAPIALVLVQRNGITWDGVFTNGLVIENSSFQGMQFKEKAGDSASLLDCTVRYTKFFNNGTSATNDLSGSGMAGLSFRRATGVRVSNCTIDGNGGWSNGLILGESGKGVADGIVANCSAYSLQGDTAANDSGIGFKAFNSDLTFTNCISTNNLKGFDLGEQTGSGTNIFYRVINCTVASNYWGCNFNGAGAARSGTHTNLLLNSLIYSNQYIGNNIYAGPHVNLIVHNTFYGNGASSNFNSASIRINNNNGERQLLVGHFYNNIFYKPSGRGNMNVHNYVQDTDSDGLTFDSDYNSWIARAGENFGYWAGGEALPDNQTYTYGANGPGHASGNWYAFYSYSTTGPTNGTTGHFHCDSHSYATSGDVTTEAPFAADYTLTTHYPGLNISTKPWYLSEMALDRNGVTRTSWDLGAFEYVATGPAATPGGVSGSARLSGGATLR